jgi:ribosome maturation factor RimP
MAATYDKERQLTREIGRDVERAIPGTEVLAVELLAPGRICVFIDHPQGVDHALCQRVTTVLEPLRRTYGIDVSSPGIERPLRKPEHFRSILGRRAALRTEQEIAGRKRFRGEVLSAGERSVRLAAGPEEPIDIPYESIVRGNLIDEG